LSWKPTEEVFQQRSADGFETLTSDTTLWTGSPAAGPSLIDECYWLGNNVFYRVTVEVVAAAASTVAAIASLVNDPAILLVFGTAAIVNRS